MMSLALNSGTPFSNSTRLPMESALASNWKRAELDKSLQLAIRLQERNDPLKLLPALGRSRGNHVGATVKRLLPSLAQLLNQLENAIANRASSSGAIESELGENQARIENALAATGLRSESD